MHRGARAVSLAETVRATALYQPVKLLILHFERLGG
jgi:hypothetical protein